MNKYELISIVIGFALFISAMVYNNHTNANCRVEAIKAGMKAEDVSKACGR